MASNPKKRAFTSVNEVKAAITRISQQISENLGKPIFRDMLAGFKVLSQSIIAKETEEGCDVVIKWLKLYLDIQSNLQPNDEKIRHQFEITVPLSVYFVISCSQSKPKNTLNYHYQLFQMVLNLLTNVKETTLQKLGNFQAGVFACLWFPIDFVGDFNTQMMAFRLLVMILKSFDVARQKQELATIKCARNKVLKQELATAITVANYHEGKFENTARNILNNYNMTMSKNVLVYSFACRSLKFGEDFEFYKLVSADRFWIDLNYCPRTLSFTGRFRASKRGKFTDVTVDFKICQMELENKTLTVGLKPPAHFSKKLMKSEILQTVTQVKLELPTEEALRFQENTLIFEYYNSYTEQNDENTMQNIMAESESSSDLLSIISDDLVPYQASVETPPPSPPMHNELTSPQTPKSAEGTNQRQEAKPAKTHFEKSYPFMVGTSDSSTTSSQHNTIVPTAEAPIAASQCTSSSNMETSQENDIFKVPSLPKYEKALHNIKVAKIQKKSLKKRHQLSNAASQVLSPKSTTATETESPLTTREKYNEANRNRELHPIAKLSEKRRFFKTSSRSSGTENDTKTMPKPRKSTRKPKTTVMYSPTAKCKQVNKVKPMNYSQANENPPENRNILNLTNFLERGNESVAVFSVSQQRTVLQNVPQSLGDVYGQLNDSDAEPGQSYRNFQTRRNESPSQKNAKGRRKQVRRRQTKKSEKKTEPIFGDDIPSTSRASAGLAGQTSTLKRSKVIISDIMKGDKKSPSPKSPRLESHQSNTNVFSGLLEIDLTCEPNEGEPVKRKSASKKEFFERYLGVASSSESHNESDSTAKPSLIQTNQASAKTPNEIQECRQANESPLRCLDKIDEINNSSSPAAPQGLFFFDDNDTPPIAECINLSRFLDIPSSSESDNETTVVNKANTARLSSIQTNEVRSKTPYEIQECREANELLLEKSPFRSLKIFDQINNSSSPAAPHNLFPFDDNDTPPNAECNNPPFVDCSFARQQLINTSNQNAIQLNTDPLNTPDEMDLDEGLMRNDCVLYCKRSDSEDISDSEDESDNIEQERTVIHQTVQTPTKMAVEKSLTTTTYTTKLLTTTSILTRQTNRTHFVSQQLFMEPANRSRTSTPNILVAQEQPQAMVLDMSNETTAVELSELSEEEINGTLTLSDSAANITDIYKQNVCSELVKIQQQEKETCIDRVMKKIVTVSENIMAEAQKENEVLVTLQKDIERIVRQLEWQHQAYQKKFKRFQCFKENSKNILEALIAIDLKKEIDREYDRMLEELKQSSHQMRTKLWREFVDECTDNLVKNIQNLSDLND